jgi:hypothetical protein
MASKRESWFKGGRFLAGAVVLFFFLPFFGISCNGMDIVKVSGADMVFGCKPGGMIAEMESDPSLGEMGGEMKVENVKREPFAILAFALGLAVFGLAWVRKKPALIGAGVLSIAAVGALAGLYVKANADIDKEMKAQKPGGDTGAEDMPAIDMSDVEQEMKVDVDAGARFGFWLTCLGYLGISVWIVMALRERDGAPTPPPTS